MKTKSLRDFLLEDINNSGVKVAKAEVAEIMCTQIISSIPNFDVKCIRKAIMDHLNKEMEFLKSDIDTKVVSIFILDSYDEDKKARYTKIFENEYKKFSNSFRYESLFNSNDNLELSQLYCDYIQYSRSKTKNINDLLLKQKTKLFSKSEPVKFIFTNIPKADLMMSLNGVVL